MAIKTWIWAPAPPTCSKSCSHVVFPLWLEYPNICVTVSSWLTLCPATKTKSFVEHTLPIHNARYLPEQLRLTVSPSSSHETHPCWFRSVGSVPHCFSKRFSLDLPTYLSRAHISLVSDSTLYCWLPRCFSLVCQSSLCFIPHCIWHYFYSTVHGA